MPAPEVNDIEMCIDRYLRFMRVVISEHTDDAVVSPVATQARQQLDALIK